MDLILAKLISMDEKIDKVEKNMIDHLDGKIKELENGLSTMNQKQEALERKLNEQATKITSLEEKLERDRKRNNIIVFNLNLPNKDDKDYDNAIISQLEQALNIDIPQREINYIKQIGKDPSGPTLISFTNWKMKRQILEGKYALKDKSNIIIKEDLPANIREKRKKLSKYWQQFKNEGIKSLIKLDKLIINNKSYSLEDLEHEEANKKRQRSEELETNMNNANPQRKRVNSISRIKKQETITKHFAPSGLNTAPLTPQPQTNNFA